MSTSIALDQMTQRLLRERMQSERIQVAAEALAVLLRELVQYDKDEDIFLPASLCDLMDRAKPALAQWAATTGDDIADRIRFHHEELKRELAEIDQRFPDCGHENGSVVHLDCGYRWQCDDCGYTREIDRVRGEI